MDSRFTNIQKKKEKENGKKKRFDYTRELLNQIKNKCERELIQQARK